jgi:hypothetical protein
VRVHARRIGDGMGSRNPVAGTVEPAASGLKSGVRGAKAPRLRQRHSKPRTRSRGASAPRNRTGGG